VERERLLAGRVVVAVAAAISAAVEALWATAAVVALVSFRAAAVA
jgi:hypothetical protein